MPEYQVTSWRDIPSMVVVRDGDDELKVPLDNRFQEAIDEAAMRLGTTGSDEYLEGWVRAPWVHADGSVPDVAERVSADLEQTWDEATLQQYLDGLGPAAQE